MAVCFFFFFSSRRRHTRWNCDWSSDVCSSDLFWAWVSDLITRRATFAVMFILQVLLFWFFPNIATVSLMTFVTFVVLMCYGGGFGTMPAFAADYFGPKNVGPVYG